MTVDGFRLLRQFSGGRHGAVWQAVDTSSGTPVALKQVLGLDANAVQRLRAEVDRLLLLSDRHLVRNHPPAVSSDECWLVENWVEGASLSAVLAGTTALTRAQALGIIRGALLGLATAHRAGVTHGELSPRSVLIDTEGQPVLVGFAGHIADLTVAGADGFASPEATTEQGSAPTADVFSVGRMLERLLSTDGVPADLRPVVQRATASDPATRHPDAIDLLADLEERAERAYGAAWWTTTGLSGIVASAAAVTAAGTVGTAAAGSGGAVTGAMSSGTGALAGAAHTAGGGVVRAARSGVSATARTGLIIAGTTVVLVAMVVGATAILRSNSPDQVNTDTAAVGPTQGSSTGPATRAPASSAPTKPGSTSTSSAPTTARSTSTPKPTPKPNPTLTFTGKYRYESVVTKSNDSDSPVGERYRTTWKVATTCQGSKCISAVTDEDDDTFALDTGAGGWKDDFTYKVECVNTRTGKETGQKVTMRYQRTIKPKNSKKGMVALSGTARDRQLKKCTNQVVPKSDVRYKITITKIK